MLAFFFFVIYFMIFFFILVDLFRSHDMSGWVKAIWIIALLFLPIITMLVYLIVRGPKMQERAMKDAEHQQKQMDAYVKSVAGSTDPTEQISKAKGLLDSGAISQEEFDALKAKALA
jgi:cellulose synthase/poly-beta-1,6-N-acetylglucosamine synthase-like glycosyltransferase